MQYDFLKDYPKRMKNVGMYAMLVANSIQKDTWKAYGFSDVSDQMNMIYAVLLYIMEQSLRDNVCTMDDIAAYIETLNRLYLARTRLVDGLPMTYNDCYELGNYIVNTILSNGGRCMTFRGYDFDADAFASRDIPISYIRNEIVRPDGETPRTSYRMTDDGYNLLLGTLEFENNMKITIKQMVIELHLKKRDYNKALGDVKDLFGMMRMQIQAIQEAMTRIRRNVLSYDISDYVQTVQESFDTIDQTGERLREYQRMVRDRIREFEEASVDIRTFSKEDEDRLGSLKEINSYLGRAIDEYQRILLLLSDLGGLLDDELRRIIASPPVRRRSYKAEVFDKVLDHPELLDRVDAFLHPLFVREQCKIFNPNMILEPQNSYSPEDEEDTDEIDDYDEEAWAAEQERIRAERLQRYKTCLTTLLEGAARGGSTMPTGRAVQGVAAMSSEGTARGGTTMPTGSAAQGGTTVSPEGTAQGRTTTLSQVYEQALRADNLRALVPSVDIFKEVWVDLVEARVLNVASLRTAGTDNALIADGAFHLRHMILQILEEHAQWRGIKEIRVTRIHGAPYVSIQAVPTDDGILKEIQVDDAAICMIGETP